MDLLWAFLPRPLCILHQIMIVHCVYANALARAARKKGWSARMLMPVNYILHFYIYVRPATRKQPTTRTGRPVPVSDVPNPKKAFFLSHFGYRTPKKSAIRI